MKIEDKRTPGMKDTVQRGQVFEYQEEFYLRLKERTNDVTCINLVTGRAYCWGFAHGESTKMRPVNAKLVIED